MLSDRRLSQTAQQLPGHGFRHAWRTVSVVRWEHLWEQSRGCVTPFFKQETEAGAWRLMRAGRTIHNRTRAANRECANERSACTHRND